MADLNHIRRELDKARTAYSEAHPEQARLLPLGNSVEYHIINALASLTDEVEGLIEDFQGVRWVSNAGPVEVASDRRDWPEED
jgi:hypothetical protein